MSNRVKVMPTRVCVKCKSERPANQFRKDPSLRDGISRTCIPCRREYESAYVKQHRPIINARIRAMYATSAEFKAYKFAEKLRRQYRMTVEQYAAMVISQDGKCKICRRTPNGRLNVDHCHETGMIRGLLCGSCNRALGLFQEDAEVVKAAAKYLDGCVHWEEAK